MELGKKIKNDDPTTGVIMVTGYKSVETATEADKLGADGYIVKPFKSEEILDIVKKKLIL